MMTKPKYIIFFLIVTSLLASSCSVFRTNETEYYEEGSNLLYYGKYEKAIEKFDKAIELKHDFIDAWKLKAEAYLKLNNYTEAIICYDSILRMKPDYYEIYNFKGVSFANLGKFPEAIECYDKLIAARPDFHLAWYNKACAYSLLKNKEQMMSALKTAIALDSKYKDRAKKDTDFVRYWVDEDFFELTE